MNEFLIIAFDKLCTIGHAVCGYLSTNHLALIGIIVGVIAAIFAALTYRLQLRLFRKEVELFINFGRNCTHVTVSATNEGRPLTFTSIKLVTEGFNPFDLNCPRDCIEYGAPFDLSFGADAVYEIPVDVKSRIVFTLSNRSTLSTSPIAFSEMVHSHEPVSGFVVKASDTLEKF